MDIVQLIAQSWQLFDGRAYSTVLRVVRMVRLDGISVVKVRMERLICQELFAQTSLNLSSFVGGAATDVARTAS